ncbi:MAG: tetratricopeptide repeat protein [Methylotenera sp.]|nr:tetratricopeptide repeat protein [Oligoflexia bacterium]
MDLHQNALRKLVRKQLFACVAALGLTLVTSFSGSVAFAAPYSDTEIAAVRSDSEAKVRELRSQEITQLRIALGRRLAGNRRADLYVRLSEIYLEGYRTEFLLEGRVHEKRLAANKVDRFIDHSHSRPFLLGGIKACEEVIRLHVPHDKLDQIHYFLGINYQELENQKESIRNFQILTRNYPNSSYVGEAYRALGDDAFEKSQFKEAQNYYENAVRKYQGDGLARVLHKLAWTQYRLKNYDRAIATMKESIAKSSQSGEKYVSLREEALRDMAIFMTEGGRVEEAVSYFQSVAGDKSFYPKALEKLGRQYERNVQPQKAIQVYESLLKTNPQDEAGFRVRVKLMDLDLRRGQYFEALKRIQGIKVPVSSDPDTETAGKNLKAMVRRTAVEQHELFRKNGTRPALDVAEAYYTLYLTQFLNANAPPAEGKAVSKEIPEIRMYLADVKREVGKSKEASTLYRQVVDSGDKRYAKEAGALWTASLADAVKKAKNSDTNEPSALEKEFIAAADHLGTTFEDLPEGRESALKAAQVLAGYKNTQNDALKRAKAIVEKSPGTSQGLTAARLWVQILSDRLPTQADQLQKSDEADRLRSAITELKANATLMANDQRSGSGKLKSQLDEQETRLRIGTIARQEKEKDFNSAAKGYESFAADATSRELAEKAYANAVSAYLKAGDYESITRVTEAWSRRFSDSKLASDAIRNAATSGLIQGQFEASAAMFEKIGKQGDANSLELSARLFEGSGNSARSRINDQLFLTRFKGSDQIPGILLNLAQSYEAEKNYPEALKNYRACFEIQSPLAQECGARLGDLYQTILETEKAKDVFRKIAGASTTAPAGKGKKGSKARAATVSGSSPFVGYARYRLAEMQETEASFSPLQLPETVLKKGLDQRIGFLQALTKSYQSAVDAGGPWAVASLDRLASWVDRFADDVDAITPSNTADSASVLQFRKSLKSISDPLRGKAMDTWKTAYQKGVAAEALSPAMPRIASRLGIYPQGFRGKLKLSGAAGNGGTEGRSATLEHIRERLVKNSRDPAAWVDYGNLIWGEGKPLLAKIAYERALGLDSRNSAALNNRGVIIASGMSQEDWLNSAEAMQFFSEANRHQELFLAAKYNRASMLNYYRVFSKSKPMWDQLALMSQSNSNSDVFDGLAIAQQGQGDFTGAAASFKKARELGADSSRFARGYHEAVANFRKAVQEGAEAGTGDGAHDCVSQLEKQDSATLAGFEKQSVENLKGICKQWKKEK